MRAGLLRDRIELLTVTSEKVHGEVISSTTPKPIRCYIHKSSGHKGVDNSEAFNFNYLLISIRNQFSITNKDRFKYEDEEYQIESISKSNDRLFLKIALKKINA